MITALLHSGDETRETTSDTWRDEFVGRGYGAFIFDCDGTLVKSSEVHFQSFSHALAEQGHNLDRDWYLARTGLDRISLFKEYASTLEPLDIDLAARRSIELFVAMSDQVTAISDTRDLVMALKPYGPMAVGTNAEKSVAEASLRATGLRQYFEHIVAISDGLPPKPSPDIFQKAYELLRADRRALVIEDSPQGVAAAIAGGFHVAQILTIS